MKVGRYKIDYSTRLLLCLDAVPLVLDYPEQFKTNLNDPIVVNALGDMPEFHFLEAAAENLINNAGRGLGRLINESTANIIAIAPKYLNENTKSCEVAAACWLDRVKLEHYHAQLELVLRNLDDATLFAPEAAREIIQEVAKLKATKNALERLWDAFRRGELK